MINQAGEILLTRHEAYFEIAWNNYYRALETSKRLNSQDLNIFGNLKPIGSPDFVAPNAQKQILFFGLLNEMCPFGGEA